MIGGRCLNGFGGKNNFGTEFEIRRVVKIKRNLRIFSSLMTGKQVMKVESTRLIIKETKEDAMARIAAANNAVNNGTDNNTNNNAAVAQSTVTKTDTVELSEEAEELSKKDESEKSEESKAQTPSDILASKQSELSSVVKGLEESGMGSKEVSKIVKTANRQANKSIAKELKSAHKDYSKNKISENEFANILHNTAIKKLDGIVSSLKDVFARQKVAAAEKNTEAVKETANETKSTGADDAAKANAKAAEEATKVAAEVVKTVNGNIIKAEKEEENKAVPPGQAKKEEGESSTTVSNSGKGLGIGNGNGNEGNAFGQLVNFFNDIDKLVNGFADEAEGKGSNDEDDGQSLVKFASKLNDMFSGINKAFGRQENEDVGHKPGMAQVKKETIGQLFDSGHGSGAINSIGDAGEGSGNFNAVSFMSSLSNNINDALDSYKDVQEAEKESKEESNEESKEEAVGTVA